MGHNLKHNLSFEVLEQSVETNCTVVDVTNQLTHYFVPIQMALLPGFLALISVRINQEKKKGDGVCRCYFFYPVGETPAFSIGQTCSILDMEMHFPESRYLVS